MYVDVPGGLRFCVNLHSSTLSGGNEDEQINCIAEPALSQLFTLWGKNTQVFLGSAVYFNTAKCLQKLTPMQGLEGWSV